MRPNKITFALGLLLITAARLSAATPLHSVPVTSDSVHPFVLIGDANCAPGGAGGFGGNGGNAKSTLDPGGYGGICGIGGNADSGNGSSNGNDSGDNNGTGNGDGSDNGGGDGGA